MNEYELLGGYEFGFSAADLIFIYGLSDYKVRKLLKKYIPGRLSKMRFTENEFMFDDLESHEDWWMIGLISSDGHIETGSNQIRIISKDLDLLEKVQELVPGSSSIVRCRSPATPYISFYTKKGIERLVELGIPRGHKCFTVKALSPPKKFIGSYMRGLFDGDGSIFIRTNGDYVVNLTGNYEVCKAFQDTILKCDNVIWKKGRSRSAQRSGTVPRQWFIDVFEELYDDYSLEHGLFLERKFLKFEEVFSKFFLV